MSNSLSAPFHLASLLFLAFSTRPATVDASHAQEEEERKKEGSVKYRSFKSRKKWIEEEEKKEEEEGLLELLKKET
ncbi:hypothetical protein E2C01_005742 [Portunus trituberculatus]|uniref:Uncharacterized protein n=1 Tax=Portunus trituberculatus TaxID=210409 RepID=A0A5B7CWA0_PORTR|nr:hypothetical protein [Portunus trituberculatus]